MSLQFNKKAAFIGKDQVFHYLWSFLTYQNNCWHDVIVSYIWSTFIPLSHLLKAKFQVLVHFQPLCLVFSSRLKSKQSFMSKIWRLFTNKFQKNFLLVFFLQLLKVDDLYLKNVPNYWWIDYNLTIVLTSRVIDNTLLLVKGLWLPILANNL